MLDGHAQSLPILGDQDKKTEAVSDFPEFKLPEESSGSEFELDPFDSKHKFVQPEISAPSGQEVKNKDPSEEAFLDPKHIEEMKEISKEEEEEFWKTFGKPETEEIKSNAVHEAEEDPEEIEFDPNQVETNNGSPEGVVFKAKDWFGEQKTQRARANQKSKDPFHPSLSHNEPDYHLWGGGRHRVLQDFNFGKFDKSMDFRKMGADNLKALLENPEAAGKLIKGFILASGGEHSEADCSETFSEASKLLSKLGSSILNDKSGSALLLLMNLLIKAERFRSSTAEKTNIKNCFKFDFKPLKRVVLKAALFRESLMNDLKSDFEVLGLGMEAMSNFQDGKFEELGANISNFIQLADKSKVSISDEELDKVRLLQCLSSLISQPAASEKSRDEMINLAKSVCLSGSN